MYVLAGFDRCVSRKQEAVTMECLEPRLTSRTSVLSVLYLNFDQPCQFASSNMLSAGSRLHQAKQRVAVPGFRSPYLSKHPWLRNFFFFAHMEECARHIQCYVLI